MLNENSSINELKGIGAKTEALFCELGISNVGELLRFFPKAYKERIAIPLRHAENGTSIIAKATLKQISATTYHGNLSRTAVAFSQDGYEFDCVFFNQPFRANMKPGTEYIIYGKIRKEGRWKPNFVNPELQEAAEGQYLREGIFAVYPVPVKSALTQKKVAQTMQNALELAEICDDMPFWLLSSLDVVPLGKAYQLAHMPHTEEELDIGLRRFAAERLLAHAVALDRHKQNYSRPTAGKPSDEAINELEKFMPSFGFSFTPGQQEALGDIIQDLYSGYQMNRIIQGDVGCGKTAVAICAAFIVASSGKQAAFLAPTEALARQHYEKHAPSLQSHGVKSALLYSSMGAKLKREAQRDIQSGQAKAVFGTHALFSESTVFDSLMLAIIDEQQRYGVAQRASLAAKAQGAVHTLSMSATPIPRSLLLSITGDVNITEIRSMPEGRIPIQTFTVDESYSERLYSFCAQRISEGERIFIVCPAIDAEDYESVDDAFKQAAKAFGKKSVAMLTGQMKEPERQKSISAFATGECKVLVATTIIEVGIDVAEATVMWVKDAHRFGMAQLHQLRGRVGRSSKQSWCILQAPSSVSDQAAARLAAVAGETDGFEIAREDLRLRGGGDRYGLRQSGKLSSITDDAMDYPDLLVLCQQASQQILAESEGSQFLKRIEAQEGLGMQEVVMN
ncbi:MAG: ATP-dependent DNA helicase RecG [Eubacteriaceae bacterium]|nr:ATP-dependent DNA helicase RecG [Eubacteriaceae bacterium]